MSEVLLIVLYLLFGRIHLALSNRPNILLLFPDQWRFDWADQYYIKNLSIHTPTFSSIVENGTRFTNVVVGSPLCAPSRACIASGKEYDYTGVPSNEYNYPQKEATIYQKLRDSGYWTMVSGKDDLTKKSGCGINGSYRAEQLGFSDWARTEGKGNVLRSYPKPTDPYGLVLSNTNYTGMYSNISEYSNYTLFDVHYHCFNDNHQPPNTFQCCVHNNNDKQHECPISEKFDNATYYEDNWVYDYTMNLLSRRPNNGTPWFLQLNYPGPHPPFAILEAMNKTVNNRNYPQPINCTYHPDEMEVVRRDYVAEIENIDKLFAKLLNYLQENQTEYENTIICVSSDHGEMLGDFNAWNKMLPWIGSSNVPLVCMGPGIEKNKIIKRQISNMDLAATFLDYAEILNDTRYQMPNMTSVTLKPFLIGDDKYEYRNFVSSGFGKWRLAIQRYNESTLFKYICCKGHCPDRGYFPMDSHNYTKILFNIQQDPYEQNNIASLYPQIVDKMNNYLPPGFCK